MEYRNFSKPRLPTSFWTVYVDLCLRHWLMDQAKKSREGDNHGATAPKPPVESRSVDTP